MNVADAGIDTTGDRQIAGLLEEIVDDDTLLVFPDGVYLLDTLRVSGYENLGFAAAPGATPILRPAKPATEINHIFIWFRNMDRFRFRGFLLDFTADGYGGATQVTDSGRFTVQNIRVNGVMPDQTLPNNPAAFRFDVTDKKSEALVQNIIARDGGHDGGNAVGLYVGKNHAGKLTFRDCHIENFPNNGLYASAPGRSNPNFTGNDGEVHVERGLYKNNNIANVRIGSTGSSVEDTTIVIDTVPPHREGSLNARGLRLRGKSEQLVSNCTIRLGENAGTSFGGVVFHPANGRATVRDTEIRIDRDGLHAINALPPAKNKNNLGSTFENVGITGSASAGRAVAINNRRECSFDNCTIEQSGTQRNGLVFRDSTSCRVANSRISVAGTPIRRLNSTVRTSNLTIEGYNGNK